MSDRLHIRPARHDEIDALEVLIAESARALGRGFYSDAETEAAIEHVFGVDSELVMDGTYLVVEDRDRRLLGCGGWSRRPTLFGSDRFAGRDAGLLDPARDAARIRAFFIAPEAARRGIGTRLLAECETRAAREKFREAALMATLPGMPFYAAHGYVAGPQIRHRCGNILVPFVPMTKTSLLQK